MGINCVLTTFNSLKVGIPWKRTSLREISVIYFNRLIIRCLLTCNNRVVTTAVCNYEEWAQLLAKTVYSTLSTLCIVHIHIGTVKGNLLMYNHQTSRYRNWIVFRFVSKNVKLFQVWNGCAIQSYLSNLELQEKRNTDCWQSSCTKIKYSCLKWLQFQSPVPWKMVKFNPRLSQIFSCLRTFNSSEKNTVEPLLWVNHKWNKILFLG